MSSRGSDSPVSSSSTPQRAQVGPCTKQMSGRSHDVTVYDLAGRVAHEDDGLRHLVARQRRRRLQAVPGRMIGDRPCDGRRRCRVDGRDGSTRCCGRLEHAAAGRRVAPAAVRAHSRAAARLATGLTEREVAVLELIAAGRATTRSRPSCSSSINTVKTYVRTAYRRIGADSRSQAVISAVRQGLGPQVEPALMEITDAAALGRPEGAARATRRPVRRLPQADDRRILIEAGHLVDDRVERDRGVCCVVTREIASSGESSPRPGADRAGQPHQVRVVGAGRRPGADRRRSGRGGASSSGARTSCG